MDYRKAFVVALLIITISKLGISEDVPDDVVYTEMKKTLVNGTKGVLTCLFKGDPNAVYWKKGSSPENAPSVMTRSYGKKFGPRYEDGSCDIDENYSLIIKHVTHEDEGRYICRVSTYKGVLEYNFTDVTVADIAVKTEPQVSVQRGKTGILPCKVLIRPRKVSWEKGFNSTLVTKDVSNGLINISGPGHEGGLFNMTKDYSLVITEVTLQHGDNYFCEVTEFYTDRIYRDLTVLAVYVPPTSPYPTIEGCPLEDHTNCIITTDSLTLTCYVNEYYPDINLFFMHGSKRVESINTQTWNNTDGTRNKSITISADQSRDAYKCIVSRIPGLGPNDEGSASVRLIQEQRISLILTAIFVPIVICLTGVLLTWMKLRRRGKRLSKEEKYMEDHISFAELWQLAEFIKGLEKDKLVSLIKSLNGNEVLSTDMNQDYYYYKEFCRWKDANAQTVKQRTALYENFSKVGMDEQLKQLEGFRKDISGKVPTYGLEHILWQIAERQKIADFLENLGVKIPTEKIPMERKLTEMKLTERKIFIQETVDQLVSWTNANLTYNPVVVLSSTLEQMGMCTADNNFFPLPNEEKEGLQDKDVQRTMRDLTKNHSEKLEKIIKASGARLEIMSTKIAEENNQVLFDTEKMLGDWVEVVACTNYERRRKLENVLQEVSKYIESTVSSYKGSDPCISDEELKIISRIDSASMASLCEKLGISSLSEDADEKGRFKTPYAWRESVTESEWLSMYGHLRNALGEVGILGLLAPLKDKPIHRAEYVDIAFTLLMSDVIPVAKALGISDNKLLAYRRVFKPTHLKKGTIGLVAHLVESTKKDDTRKELCSRLREAGFPLAIARNILVHRMAYGELHAISEEMKRYYCEEREKYDNHGDDNPHGEGDSLLGKDNTSTAKEVETLQEKQAVAKRHLNEIKKLLKLSNMIDEDLAECLDTKECDDELAWFRIWKERPHLPVFNERAAIIQGLFDMQRNDIARSVAEGNYYNTEISLPFLQYIVKKMEKDEVLRLAEVFKLKKEVEDAKATDDFAHVASGIIHGSIRKNISGKIKFLKANEYKTLLDKLVDNGFLDIAQELLIIQK